MTALAEKMRHAGVDTLGARLTTLLIDGIRLHPCSVIEVWKYAGEQFGYELVRTLMKDFQGSAPTEPSATDRTDVSYPLTLSACGAKQLRSKVVAKETVERRRKQAEAVRSKFCNSGGIWWSEVSVHELYALARDGNEASALLAACPPGTPNDGRTIGQVLGVKLIDKIIGELRR